MPNTINRMSPIHPREILLEDFLKPMQINQKRLALDTGMPQSRIQAIVARKRSISTDTAIRLSAYFGNSAEFWLNAQNLYELQLGYVFKLFLLLSGFVGLVFYYGYVCLYTRPS